MISSKIRDRQLRSAIMQLSSAIQRHIKPYFIVIAIFLFGADPSLAALRPYLPVENSIWPSTNIPLASGVSKIQAKKKDPNTVIWVPYGSEKFSDPVMGRGVADNISQTAIFAGFQDIDAPSDFTKFVEVRQDQVLPPSIRRLHNYSGERSSPTYTTSSLDDDKQLVFTTRLPRNPAPTLLHNTELAAEEIDPVPNEYATPGKMAKSTQINVWADLDS